MRNILLATTALALVACGDKSKPTEETPAQKHDVDATNPGQSTDQSTPPATTAPQAGNHTQYSPYPDRDFPTQVLWGDTHLHTRLSQDAFTFGVTLGPDEAFRFAKGETITATHGQKTRLKRPLDFLVVSDHAEGLGAMQALMDGDRRLTKDKTLRDWRKRLTSNDPAARTKVADEARDAGWPEALDAPAVRNSAWEYSTDLADQHYQPGIFTSLIGFEWTSWPGGSNLHRVVIFEDDAEMTQKITPLSSNENDDPEHLWAFLNKYEDDTGGSVLAIPHNGNLSNGLMFPIATESGGALSDEYLATRARWEPVVEMTQIKGDGETHPFLSPDDAFADYETWDFGNFTGVPKTNEMLKHEYARSALKLGLALEKERGVNPYKFGMIGASDSHTGLSAVGEDNFFGKHSAAMEPQPNRWKDPVGKADAVEVPGALMASSGYAGVWAHENTRESIFAAIKRKEVYATTGTRLTVRFFGGWNFNQNDIARPDIAATGYEKGVPMGSDLVATSNTKAPSFLISALRDPDGANLDRVQIVKGWVDDNGETQERVYDVTWADPDKRSFSDGVLTLVGSTVDAKTATYTNTIGAPELKAVWTDPDFDEGEHAFYYVRVLEIATPRWTMHDAAVFGVDMPDTIRREHQERAYTSPIWYTPQSPTTQ